MPGMLFVEPKLQSQVANLTQEFKFSDSSFSVSSW